MRFIPHILTLLATTRAFITGQLPAWSVAVIGSATVLALVGVIGLPELLGDGSDFALFALIGVAGLVAGLVIFRAPAQAAPAVPTEAPA